VAVAAIRAANAVLPIPDEAIQQGLSTVRWPGRLQIIERPGGKRILLDGAHNIAGAEALKQRWTIISKCRPALVLGIRATKTGRLFVRCWLPELNEYSWHRLAAIERLLPRFGKSVPSRQSNGADNPHGIRGAGFGTGEPKQAVWSPVRFICWRSPGTAGLSGSAEGERGLNEWIATRDATHSPIRPQSNANVTARTQRSQRMEKSILASVGYRGLP